MAILERLLLVLDLKLCLVQVSWSAPRFLCGVRSNGVVTGINIGIEFMAQVLLIDLGTF